MLLYLCRHFIGIRARSLLKLAFDIEAPNLLMQNGVVWDTRPADGQMTLRSESTKIV